MKIYLLKIKSFLSLQKIAIVSVLLVVALAVNAQAPINDDPCNAITLVANPTCVYQTFTNANATGSVGVPAPGCASYSGGDVWFKVVVPASGTLAFDTQTGVITDGGMAIYNSTTSNCGNLTLIECDDDDSQNGAMPFINRSGLTPNDTIWIRVWEYGNNGNGTFGICVREVPPPPPPPANDEPCNAIALTPGSTCVYQTFSNESATASVGIPAPGCASYSGGDVWFSVVVPAGGSLIFDTQTGVILDGGMAIYRGTCDNLTLIECDDDDSQNGAMPYINRTGLTPGSTIWIRVWEYGNNNNGTFGICVKFPPPPPLNNEACAAFSLFADATCNYQTFSNEGATASAGVPAPGCANYIGSDVWFSVDVPASGLLAIDTRAGEMTDGGMAVYSGVCSSLRLVACDDNTGTGNMPQLRLDNLVPFSTVFIRVWENGNDNNGSFGICVTEPTATPVNNDACNAVIINPTLGCNYQTFTNVNATATVGVPAPTCGNYFGGDVWFQATIPATGSIDIDTRSGTIRDAAMSVYKGTSCAGLTQILCDDNSSVNSLMPFLNISGQIPGSTIWIRLWGKDSATRVGTFDICVSIPAAEPTTFNFNCNRDTTVGCGIIANCFSLQAVIPNIHASTANYQVNPISGTAASCFNPYTAPGGPGPSTALTIDDRYTDSPISLPFPFPFFGTNYSQIAASTNGYISFDATLAVPFSFSHYAILNNSGTLSATNGTPQNLPSTLYDRAIIMGPYHDLDPSNASPGQKIKYNVIGTAPNRKWVLSTFKTPLFYDAGGCDTLIRNTHQIVLYEGTGIIEVFVFDKQICTGWNQGRAMIGIQNFARNAAVMAPGRRASDAPWGTVGMNESWRFVPSEGPTLFRRVELYDENDVLVATGDTSSINGTSLRVNFDNVCPPTNAAALKYIVKSYYTSSLDPTVEITGTDTITVRRGGGLAANFIINNVKCNGANDATIAINPTLGTAPFQYSINGGINYQAANTFNNVAAGTYNVSVKDINGCTKDTAITILEPTKLIGTYQNTAAKCAGAANGTITVSAFTGTGTAPYTYALDALAYQTNNVFTVAAGTYIVHIKDVNNCIKDTLITVSEPFALATTLAKTDTKCNGSSDGTITINTINGTAPYTYSIDNGVNFQTNNTFTVAAGTYNIRIKDANDCIKDTTITVSQPALLSATNSSNNATCSTIPNGQITVTAAGGTSPFSYSIDGTNFQASNAFTTDQGNYTITVKDANGCTKPITITVGFTFDLTLQARQDTSICDNIAVKLNTISNALNYSWTNASSLSNGTVASPLANPTATTEYIVTATTGSCVLKDTVVITVSVSPTVFAGDDVTVVKGDDATLNATVDNTVSFVWTPSTYLSNPNALNIVSVRPQETTIYRLTATNSIGCSKFDEVKVIVLPYCIKVKSAFSPNGDGVNDNWMVYDQFDCLTNVSLTVFNRYGSKVYENRNYRNEWKGTYNGQSLPDATYYYEINFTLSGGRIQQVRGDVTILR